MKNKQTEFLKIFFEFVKNGVAVDDFKSMMKVLLKKFKDKFSLKEVKLQYFSEELSMEFSLRDNYYKESPVKYRDIDEKSIKKTRRCKKYIRYSFLIEINSSTRAVFSVKANREFLKDEIIEFENLVQVIFTYFLKLYKSEKLALIDELTGLYNHKYLMQYLEKEVEKSSRYNERFSIIFIDLDGLKSVNDNYGHIYGAKTLKEVGKLLKRYVRSSDIVARFGGDEFVVVAFRASKETAKSIALRLRDKIKNHVFLAEEGFNLKLSASFGIACFPEHAKTAEELIKKADEAMYYVKRRGKDGVAIIDEKEDDDGNYKFYS